MASESKSRDSHRRYDLSMSRRTRKPASSSGASPRQNEPKKEGSDGLHHISLKELIIEESERVESNNADDQRNGVHSNRVVERGAEEDKGLPIVAVEEVKTSSMVSHCVKVLNHLIRAKRTSKKKKNQKNVVPLLMQ